ncbi:unnamed protein product [Clavelina lepadiformis]|uniref:Uncharacterized protein n=1 Tax=Clavelina lepadiformis TaxID=159417 RepID=A0ABP0G8T3_CLALP
MPELESEAARNFISTPNGVNLLAFHGTLDYDCAIIFKNCLYEDLMQLDNLIQREMATSSDQLTLKEVNCNFRDDSLLKKILGRVGKHDKSDERHNHSEGLEWKVESSKMNRVRTVELQKKVTVGILFIFSNLL